MFLQNTMSSVFRLLIIYISVTVIEGEGRNQPPNIIFILADDLGWNDVAFHGNTEIPTPNINALAADGIILNKYYVTPLCTPSRAALMTGLYPSNVGLQNNVIDDAGPWGLPLNFKIFPNYMKDLGYTTKMIGKWHLGFYQTQYTPTFRGFDDHYGFWGSATDHFHHTGLSNSNGADYIGVPSKFINSSILFVGLDFRKNLDPVRDMQERYLADIYTEKATEVLKSHNKSKPLFMYLAHHSVHRGNWLLPVRAPAKYVEGFQFIQNKTRQQFAGAITALDQSIGEIVRTLNDEGMLDNTIIVFSTDNGGDQMTFTSNGASNWPLRGQKFTCWEGGTRGVGFVWSTLLKNRGRTSDQMLDITDWLPTLYTAAGGDASDVKGLDGIPMWDVLSLDLPSPRNLTLINVDSVDNTGALIVGDFKILTGSSMELNGWYGPTARDTVAPSGFRNHSIVAEVLREFYNDPDLIFQPDIVTINCGRRPTESVYECHPKEAPCLFNLKDDPCEYWNLANKYPKLVQELYGYLSEFNATQHPPLNVPLAYKADPLSHNGLWSAWGDTGSY